MSIILEAEDVPTDLAEFFEPISNGVSDTWRLGPEPYAEAHFAVMPSEIPRRAILAGTSAKGCCPKCYAPWVRVTERSGGPPKGDHRKRDDFAETEYNAVAHPTRTVTGGALSSVYAKYGYPETRTVGWEPGCECAGGEPAPCTVLDPFAGAGTTWLVARRYGRRFMGCELNPEYARMAEARVAREWREQPGRPVTADDAPLFAMADRRAERE